MQCIEMRSRCAGMILGTLLATSAWAAEPQTIPLWPGAAPGSENANYPETEIVQGVRQVHNVTRPVLLAFLPDPAKANGTAWIVCPGGGFQWLAIEYEGTDLAHWLNAQGIAAFVLKYRVMRTGEGAPQDPAGMPERRRAAISQAVADGGQAITLVRSRAAEWHVAPDRIGIIGFSAGGYIAAALALDHDARNRPNFAAPIYGAMPSEMIVPADAPPLFIAQATDDKLVPPLDTSIRIYTAWKKAGIPVELHMYAQGGHGFGMVKKNLPSDTWVDRFRDWMNTQGLLKPTP
jgi:acetyl esterase/lipase